jgi:uncharacterized phage protein (TIGR02220 family)
LVNVDPDQSSLASHIISEAKDFSAKKRDAANKRWDAQHKQKDAQHMQSNARSSSSKEESKPIVLEIVKHLNLSTGKKFSGSSRATAAMVNARLAEGFTVADFKTVIDNMTVKWKNDPKMNEYLRPETLFRPSHFESYLNAKPVELKISKPQETYGQ